MIVRLAVALCAAALFGFALGWAHDPLYATRNLVKFPLLIATTATTCAASYWLSARLLGLRLPFLATQRLAWKLYDDASVLLGSLAPAVFFLACVLRATDDGRLGEYDRFLAANVALIALAGTIALVRQARSVAVLNGVARGRARAIVVVWLLLSLLVGGQASFWMRPFFGFPATRGWRPPFFFMNTPDLRGATNFFEAVGQALRHPGLPSDLEERMRELGR